MAIAELARLAAFNQPGEACSESSTTETLAASHPTAAVSAQLCSHRLRSAELVAAESAARTTTRRASH